MNAFVEIHKGVDGWVKASVELRESVALSEASIFSKIFRKVRGVAYPKPNGQKREHSPSGKFVQRVIWTFDDGCLKMKRRSR